jgi:hypothetical protein
MTESPSTSVLVLNARPLWIRLLFRELGRHVPTTGAVFHLDPTDAPVSEDALVEAPGWTLTSVRLPRRSFGRLAAWHAPHIHRRLVGTFGQPDVVVFTEPSQRALCNRFAGTTRIYYVADDYRKDYGYTPGAVEAWERQIVPNVEHVVCVSDALADSLVERLPLTRDGILVSANGLPAGAITEASFGCRTSGTHAVPACERPLAGVFGTINRRIRLDWLRQLLDSLPWLNLLLVGPRVELDADHREHWDYLSAHTRCTIVGEVGYYELFRYASQVDLGLIPLTDDGINPTCSPTRFFTQLPFGQPIVASESSLQLREFQPLVTISTTLSNFISTVEGLYRIGFDDRLADARRAAAREHTWEKRAECLYQRLIHR